MDERSYRARVRRLRWLYDANRHRQPLDWMRELRHDLQWVCGDWVYHNEDVYRRWNLGGFQVVAEIKRIRNKGWAVRVTTPSQGDDMNLIAEGVSYKKAIRLADEKLMQRGYALMKHVREAPKSKQPENQFPTREELLMDEA